MKKRKLPLPVSNRHKVVFRKTEKTNEVEAWPSQYKSALNILTASVESAADENQLRELYFQILMHHKRFERWSAKSFCMYLGLDSAYGADFEFAMGVARQLSGAGYLLEKPVSELFPFKFRS
jgi:hypothetical protein